MSDKRTLGRGESELNGEISIRTPRGLLTARSADRAVRRPLGVRIEISPFNSDSPRPKVLLSLTRRMVASTSAELTSRPFSNRRYRALRLFIPRPWYKKS